MPHSHPTKRPSQDDLVFVRIALPRKMVVQAQPANAVYIRTCRGGLLQFPKSLLKEFKTDPAGGSTATLAVFEARVARGVSTIFRAVFAELFRSAALINDPAQ